MTEHHHDHCGHEHCDHDHHHEPTRYEQAFEKFDLHLHDEQVLAEVEQLVKENIDKYRTKQALRDCLAAVELTTLTVTDSDESVLAMVEKVNRFYNEHPEFPPVATICTYPNFSGLVRNSLEVEGIRPICVVGGFPSSQTFLEIKTVETALAVRDGAEEVDMVLSVGKFLSGDYETCTDEIQEIKAAAGDAPLKVILETGALQTAVNIKKASILSFYAGADFIKTSTGKISVAATPFSAYVMCKAIREYYDLTGIKIGFKAAGGVSNAEDALTYYTIVREILGEEWIKENLFRIGTSRATNVLVGAIDESDLKMI